MSTSKKQEPTIKLYKFRPLGSTEDFRRALDMIQENKFWHSRFSELNDPMEGSFTIFPVSIKDVPAWKVVEAIYSQKNKHCICSFSNRIAFKKPVLWGYYANGFKGIAIEVTVKKSEVVKMNYGLEIPHIDEFENIAAITKNTLTNKLDCWKHEKEFRSLQEMDHSDYFEIGEVTAVYFGNPYERAANQEDIIQNSRALKDFKKYSEDLLEAIIEKNENSVRNISCYTVKIEDGIVVKGTELTRNSK